ncbi:MAG TPA: lysophospholipid acyltransferase family protein [Burkholderiaceae bacterium]|nr:lysophospholipid acyltransferase family protein [Burkholderiaceae bacterium]
MRTLVGGWRVLRAVLHLLHGMGIVALRSPRLDAAERQQRIAWWSRGLLKAIGVQLIAGGTFRPGANLLVANHISWLDIAAMHAACPRARFVAKADVRHWPLLGWLIGAVGTLYIERERKRDALRVVHQVAEALIAGEVVAVFPEGTTGDGRALLPFHANLLQAAIATQTPVQPVALRYTEPGLDWSPAASWLGEMPLLANVWAIACARGVQVRLDALAARGSAHADRRALAQRLRDDIAHALDLLPRASAPSDAVPGSRQALP